MRDRIQDAFHKIQADQALKDRTAAFAAEEIRRRSEKGLLSGLWEFPWTAEGCLPLPLAHASGLQITHVFTHIRQTLTIYCRQTDESPIADGIFVAPFELDQYPFSTMMKKVYRKALAAGKI